MSDTSTTAYSTLPFVPRTPFDDSSADVILRSSDGIDFHVHRVVLSLASSFFKEMFSLPQPSSEPDIPTISMSESAVVLDRALRFWYPGAEPVLVQTLHELRETLEILIQKYYMQFVIPLAKKHLREYLQGDPVAVFAIACRHEWKDLALEAAKSSLRAAIRNVSELPRPTNLNDMTADTYYALLLYHSECARVAAAASSSLEWVPYSHEIPGSGCLTDRVICPTDYRTWNYADVPQKGVVVWFAGYLQALAAKLANSPNAILDSPELLTLAGTRMSACPYCRENGFHRLAKFIVTLKAKIQREIDSVELPHLNF
ncbi:hypothetical protein B0H11DRAFT_1914381 [Mycena galericulata]|nr:hypothetical protein B0H11DRAFT_1914381 [Mycena galericulata]